MIFTLGFMVTCVAIVGCVSGTGVSEPPALQKLKSVELNPDFWIYGTINLGNLGARAKAGAFVYNLDTGTKRRISNHSEPRVRVHGHVALISKGC